MAISNGTGRTQTQSPNTPAIRAKRCIKLDSNYELNRVEARNRWLNLKTETKCTAMGWRHNAINPVRSKMKLLNGNAFIFNFCSPPIYRQWINVFARVLWLCIECIKIEPRAIHRRMHLKTGTTTGLALVYCLRFPSVLLLWHSVDSRRHNSFILHAF